jgi:hypothetical protein
LTERLRAAWQQASVLEQRLFLDEIGATYAGRKPIDLTGQRFGKLVALHREPDAKGALVWVLRCDCGNTHRATAQVLRRGDTRSCGCAHYVRHKCGRLRAYGKWEAMERDAEEPNSFTDSTLDALNSNA